MMIFKMWGFYWLKKAHRSFWIKAYYILIKERRMPKAALLKIRFSIKHMIIQQMDLAKYIVLANNSDNPPISNYKSWQYFNIVLGLKCSSVIEWLFGMHKALEGSILNTANKKVFLSVCARWERQICFGVFFSSKKYKSNSSMNLKLNEVTSYSKHGHHICGLPWGHKPS